MVGLFIQRSNPVTPIPLIAPTLYFSQNFIIFKIDGIYFDRTISRKRVIQEIRKLCMLLLKLRLRNRVHARGTKLRFMLLRPQWNRWNNLPLCQSEAFQFIRFQFIYFSVRTVDYIALFWRREFFPFGMWSPRMWDW